MRNRLGHERLWSRLVAALSLAVPVVLVALAAPAHAEPDPLAVVMSASADPVTSGTSLTYTITATNREPQAANVRLTDQLTGLTDIVLTSTRGYCQESALLVTCSAGSMPGSGSTWTVRITGLVTAGAGTYLSNTASVMASWSAQNTSHDYAVPATTNVLVANNATGALAELSSSIIGPSTAAPSANVNYTLTINNTGAVNASDVLVSATLPPSFSLQPGKSVVGTSLFACTASLTSITCLGGAVNAGANATISIPAVVSPDSPVAPATSLAWKLTAVVDPENAIPEINELNNASQHVLSVPASPAPVEPITFSKSASTTVDPALGTQVRPGDLITYTLTAKNTSAKVTSTRLEITDGTQGLNQAAVSAKASDPKYPCTNSGSQVKCIAPNNGYTLAAGASITVTVTGRVVQPPSSIITNTATLQTLQGKVSITRTASVTTIVRPPIDLTVTHRATCASPLAPELLDGVIAGQCAPFRARNQFDYLVTVGNSGLDDATGTRVRVPLPSGVVYEGYTNIGTSGGFTCDEPLPPADPTVVTCSGGTVPGQLSSGIYPGTTRQLRLHLTAPNSVGPITTTVTVDPYNALPESDETNNTSVTTTPIATGVDLTITQVVLCPRDSRTPAPRPLPAVAQPMCDPAAPSGTIVYDLQVQNLGTQDATAIKVSDVLPTGTRFRSAREVPAPALFGTSYTPTHLLSCTGQGTQVDCTGGQLKGIYAAYGGPKLHTSGKPDGFVIEVTAFAPAPYGPTGSAGATGSPILNQALVDPAGTIPEFDGTNDLNVLETNVGIPPTAGDWGTFNELSITNVQSGPASGDLAPGGTLEYTLTVSNWGSDPVSNVTVTDAIPQGARFRNVTADPLGGGTGGFVCSANGALVTCANGALAASPAVGSATSTTIRILLFAPGTVSAATTRYTNHAVVDPANAVAEADETNDIADATLTVSLPTPNGSGQNTFNDLVVDNVQTRPGSGVAVAPNGSLEYTLTVKNRGSDPVDKITVSDYLPQGSRFRNVTAAPLSAGSGGFQCGADAGVVTCTNGSLVGAAGLASPSTTTIKVLLFAPDTPNDITSEYTNHAVVDPSNAIPEGDETNNVTDVALVVQTAPTGQNAYNELKVTSAQLFPAADGAVAPGGTLVYHLTVANTGTDVATHIVVRDVLPDGTTYRKARLAAGGSSGVAGFVCSQASGVVTCDQGSIRGGGQAVLEVTLFAPTQPSSLGSLATITNQALVDPANTIPEGDETNNTSTSDTTVQEGGAGSYWDLDIDQVGSDTTGQPDQFVKYVLNVRNLGTDDLLNATVRDVLPGLGATFGAARDAAGGAGAFTCAVDADVVTCTGGTLRGSLNGGAARSIEVAVTAPHRNILLRNQAQADPGNAVVEADENNNTTTTVTDIRSVINLTVALSGSVGGAGSTGTIAAAISNTNTGAGSGTDALDVLSEINLPVGVTPLDVVAPAGTTCQITQNPISRVTCRTLVLSPGAGVSISFSAYSNTDETKNANALINGDGTTVESDSSDNTAVATV
ncbi:MAG: hypothetical protein JWM64_49 [Frankiales bacterium]|nr:hypothetical protein [Frankiales bacterium]